MALRRGANRATLTFPDYEEVEIDFTIFLLDQVFFEKLSNHKQDIFDSENKLIFLLECKNIRLRH